MEMNQIPYLENQDIAFFGSWVRPLLN